MSINIADLVKSYVSQDLISKAGILPGEDEGSISKAISGLIPAILGGVAAKANQSEADAQQWLDEAKLAHHSGLPGSMSSLPANEEAPDQGSGWLNKIFGGQSNGIINTLSGFSGIKSSSLSSLVSVIAPLIMGLLGKQAVESNLDASGFSGFLSTQKANILGALPSGLGSIAATLGLGAIETATGKAAADTAQQYVANAAPATGGALKWLLPLLLLAAAAFLLWWLMGKGCKKEPAAARVDTMATAPLATAALTPAMDGAGVLDTVTGNYIYNVGAGTEIKLADGTTLKVGENSTEARLYRMLNDAAFVVDTADKKANWVVLDRVYFETGKSVLTAESAAQILNIGSILKNFPKAAIKLGGYTDNTGDAAINKKVSAERAKIVAGEMVKAGAGAGQVIEAEGYGSGFPVCEANDTPECKAQNRRVDLKVAMK